MKWMISLIFAGFLFTACDNDLVVIDDWKDIPVVWGFVSKSDTAHYIRVEKAFLDPNTSAFVIAQIPDSLYYDQATVTLKRIATEEVHTLEKVDGNLEGYQRESGDFADAPNYLYKIRSEDIELEAGEEYEFSLIRNEITTPVTARTIILPQPVLRNPTPGKSLSFRPNSNFNFNWNDIEDAGVYDLHMRFNYQEKSPATGNEYDSLSVEWVIAKGLYESEYKIDGVDFYNAINANIPDDPMATRLIGTCDIIVWCGGEELAEYLTITLANTGITSVQDFPQYTNLSEGRGIFTSRNVADVMDYGLTDQTQDSLRDGSITGHLNFQ